MGGGAVQEILRFADRCSPRPRPSGIDVQCRLQHFAIVTYAVEPERIARLVAPRFALDTVVVDGHERALLSVVPFLDTDFTSAVYPFPRFTMGQTNYRIYVRDRETGSRCVWFLGTSLDSWTVFVPARLWKLPWYRGHIAFDCAYDDARGAYTHYRMNTRSAWAPATIEITQREARDIDLPGFPDTETGLVVLTHPLTGYYHRRDGRLGSYRIWHDRLPVQPAQLASARFGLLERLGVLSADEQQAAHSVLVLPSTDFTIYLPPRAVV